MQFVNSHYLKKIISYLKKAYASVNDIDIFIGGVTEIPQGGAIIGPTFANMFAKQFDRLKQGDRFFYDNNVSSGNRVPQFTAGIQLHYFKNSVLLNSTFENHFDVFLFGFRTTG